MTRIAALFVLLAIIGCSEISGDFDPTITYSIVFLNEGSPDVPSPIGFSQYRVAIPRASIILHPNGTVEERMEYVITHATNSTRIAATDTTFGHYVRSNGVIDIRLPNATGSEVYAGSGQVDAGQLLLSRSWMKDGITVSAEIAYFRSN
jgi:hypothetical protein